MTPRISLCMIVRDEAAVLARCLASARGVVDEICVVDTGSVDRTPAIAAEWGARVQRIPWPNSFAEARNVSLEMATGEWVLVLDADEVLAAETASGVRDLASREDLAGALFAFRHQIDGKTVLGRVLRFFRNDPAHRFVGAVHEQLGPAFEERAAQGGQRILLSHVVVDHDGYDSAVQSAKGKAERNLALFERGLREDPQNAYLCYKFADFLRGQGQRERAVEMLEELCTRLVAASEDVGYAFHAEAVALLVLELVSEGRVREAGKWLRRARGRFPKTAHFHFARATWAARSERWDAALAGFVACRHVTGPAAMQVPAPGIVSWRSSLGMADALEHLGRGAEAEELLRNETLRSADVPEVYRAHAALLARIGQVRRALDVCLAGLRCCADDAELWVLCSELLLQAGCLEDAQRAALRGTGSARGGPDLTARVDTVLQACAQSPATPRA